MDQLKPVEEWQELLLRVVVAGIVYKINNSIPLTEAQQAIVDSCPKYFNAIKKDGRSAGGIQLRLVGKGTGGKEMDVLKLMTRRMLCRIGIHAWTKTRATIKKSEYVLLYIDDYKCKFCGKFRYQKQTDELRQMAKSFERRTKCTLPRNY